jgi:hypothetical protein
MILKFQQVNFNNIHIVSVDTDYFFIPDENRETFEILKPIKQNVSITENTFILMVMMLS